MAETSNLDQDILDDLAHYTHHGLQLIGVDENSPPEQIVRSITEYVRELKTRGDVPQEDDVLGLGILLGQQYVRGFAWRWARVVWDGDADNDAIGVLPQDDSLFINPMWWMNDTVSTDRSTNFMLNYNMVAANKIPPATPGEAMGFH
ncbi:hypothetical protein [Chitinilyticum piscinae]|uniref:Uncharacterized protein n=1 Tax=Chitinilyticum piscinae TaxID=2866724 RepID=A0A8J7FHD7_9NEIS|nr:hypothetical protein [Chitinilyticum piscinae]MBE9608235.1 hypothetical protein [Chitinilyticum piscinae]